MRTAFLVTYDICDDRRLRQVYKTMRGFGEHIQYSVFQCDLSDRELAEMVAALEPLIDHLEDQVLIVDLGPPDGRAASCIRAIGRRYALPPRQAIVI